jgi:hypothetical protein
VGFFEALEGPGPRLKAGGVVGRLLQSVRPVRPTDFWFMHDESFRIAECGEILARKDVEKRSKQPRIKF